MLLPRELSLKGELGRAMKEVRTSAGDLSALLEVIRRGQSFAVEFCAALENSR